MEKKHFKIHPIGFVRKNEQETKIEVLDQYSPALLQLEKFSHLITIWWITGRDNEDDRNTLIVNPRVNGKEEKTPDTGVFACRAPLRPNPLGLTIVKILMVEDNFIYIDRTDAFDNTPIIDLKPYIPNSDCILNTKVPEFMASIGDPREE